MRFHDAPIENSGHLLIDVSRIFPLFHLDENDSRNYRFAQTDDYLSPLQGRDIDIDFRMGETIDHSGNGRLIGVPEDLEKWARICRNIIGHYKNGEMDGMYLNITRVTVWEEPDNTKLFGGTVEDYSMMFCKLYQALKSDFPTLEVGGPTMMSGKDDYLKDFLRICRDNGVTPDYISSTVYADTTSKFNNWLLRYRDATDSDGLPNIKHRVAEWHLGPTSWDPFSPDGYSAFYRAENAAFSCEALIKFMDLDFVDTVYYYAWATSVWSVMSLRPVGGLKPGPVYYGLLFFQKLATECVKRLDATWECGDGITCLAGVTGENRLRLLVSCLREDTCKLLCQVKGAKTCSLRAVTEDFNETAALEPHPPSGKRRHF